MSRKCNACSLHYYVPAGYRFVRWFFNQSWDWVDSRACPSTYCRGQR
jgi:hypothetical protein